MDVREQLVAAGVELLEQGGLANLTQRRIALKVGVSHGAPRHHFPTYASLLAAIARRGIDDLDQIITSELAADDAFTALAGTCRRVVEFAIERPAMFELIARHDLLVGGGEDLRGTTRQWLARVTERIQSIRPDADQRHALALWATVQGLGAMCSRGTIEAITEHAIAPDDILSVVLHATLSGVRMGSG